MTDTLEARYRRVAEALTAKDVESGLLDECWCVDAPSWDLIAPEHRTNCTGTVVPQSEGERTLRLLKAARHVQIQGELDMCWAMVRPQYLWSHGPTIELALLAAMEALT